ncbi:NAD-dependent epimerase/dehydratase family protein [Nonomuraea cavernae]|uniref:NAD-dependent epimerase/dehydratase family protein n=1 Tax=Nonomuraea cavernae TaxID=2045107 RepID=UPI0033D1D3BC
MTAVVLFGATGFLGRQVKDRLAADSRVTQMLCPGRARLDLLAASVADVADLLAAVRPSVVLNCVGRLSGGYDELVRGNAGVTAILIEAMAQVTPKARFVRLGSAAEYGPARPDHSLREQDAVCPVSAYGVSHLAGTLLVEQAAAEGRLDGASLRIFNPIGPGISGESVLGRARALLDRAVTDGLDRIDMGPLGAYRDFVDVRDVAEAVVSAGFAAELTERVFNVGSGVAVAVRDVVGLLAEESGFAGEVRESALGSARSPAVDWSRADIDRARQVLGWQPRFQLGDSVKAMV